MGPPLFDDTWTRRGISILWDAEQLDRLCKPSEVISVRQFIQLHNSGWPDDDLPLINDRTLVVAGLESCIDALKPGEAIEWLEETIYQTILSYQQDVADGGSQAALIFWLAEQRRLLYQTSDDTYYWYCSTEYKGEQVPLGQCLFNGAHHDLRPIHVVDQKKKEHWVGLYHPRIS